MESEIDVCMKCGEKALNCDINRGRFEDDVFIVEVGCEKCSTVFEQAFQFVGNFSKE